MKKPTDKDRLLSDVFGDGALPSFREEMLGQALKQARHRHRARRARHLSAACTVLCLLMFSLYRLRHPQAPAVVALVANEPSQSLAGWTVKIVTTVRFAPDQSVTTFPNISVVSTIPGPEKLRLIADDELLALMTPRVAVLVRTSPDSQKLILLNPEESKTSRVN